jgi:hypothetical protein
MEISTNSKVIPLHPDRPRLGQFIRVGQTGHRQLEALLESGRLPVDRVVLAASAVGRQIELASSLRRRRVELVLDTDVAELSVVGRFEGAVGQAPWAQSRPLQTRDFDNPRIASEIARFAVQYGFQAVLAPTHFLGHGGDSWLQVDGDACQQLRIALDTEGGRGIAIDYEIIMPYQSLRDDAYRLHHYRESSGNCQPAPIRGTQGKTIRSQFV